jgi:hypothetical protein
MCLYRSARAQHTEIDVSAGISGLRTAHRLVSTKECS